MTRGPFGLLIILIVADIPVRQVLLWISLSPWWTLFVLVPVANLVVLWIFAFSNRSRQSSQPGNVLPNQD